MLQEIAFAESQDSKLEDPGVEVLNPELGRRSSEGSLWRLLTVSLFVIMGLGGVLIKRERDITLQMEGE